MVTVALAGASSGMGLTMLKTFIHMNNGKHTLVLLSRSAKPDVAAQGVDVRTVDYANHAKVVDALQGVHTVLSIMGSAGMKDGQLALIAACKEAGVKRFAPSEYAVPIYKDVDLYAGKAAVWEATRASGMEYTRFSCGLFMGLLATGTPKPMSGVGEREGLESGEQEALAGVRPWNYVINMLNGTADFAGQGAAPMGWTEMRDIAKFVFHALDLETWPEDLGMRGDVKSFADCVRILERVQKRKFLTRSTAVEVLEERIKGTTNPLAKFYDQGRVAFEKGGGVPNDELNKLFPDVKPVNCTAFIEKWWGGVELSEASWDEGGSVQRLNQKEFEGR